MFPYPHECPSQVDVGAHILLINLDGLPIADDCFFIPLNHLLGHPKVKPRILSFRAQKYCLSKVRESEVNIPSNQEGFPQPIISFRVKLVVFDGAPVGLDSRDIMLSVKVILALVTQLL